MSDVDVLALQDRFGRPGIVRFEAGAGGLARAVVTTPAAEAQVYLQGAHVTHYQPRGGAPLLFMSRRSMFEPGKPIRAGVPVVFPWFGLRDADPHSQLHGFARLMEWTIGSVGQVRDDAVEMVFELRSEERTRAIWPHDFALRFTVTIGAALEMALEAHNSSEQPFIFEEALHTYLAVADVRRVSIHGLSGTRYVSKVHDMKPFTEGEEPVRITGETDRVFLNTRATCTLDDPAGGRRINIEKGNSDVTVVWNPWADKARSMPDFGDDEWMKMICVETANAREHAVNLPPGASHIMRAVVRAAPL